MTSSAAKCVIIGASHAGVTAAFNLRQRGWQGEILIVDRSAHWPHQKPPLSKAYLLGKATHSSMQLKSQKAFEDNAIALQLDATAEQIDRSSKRVKVNDCWIPYTKLILAIGCAAFVPPIDGIKSAKNLLTMRDMKDAEKLKSLMAQYQGKAPRVVIIGAGYIGLEGAAALTSLGAQVTVLEREQRVLARVTSPFTSEFMHRFHQQQGVQIYTGMQVGKIDNSASEQQIRCANGKAFPADIILVGTGVRVNQHLAAGSGLDTDNGILVDAQCRTSDPDIFAVGDCTSHFNARYQRQVRLESVQNAVDQAKTAAGVMCDQHEAYDKLPWFWSDQFSLKLQMVGLSSPEDEVIVRQEKSDANSLSVWYFSGKTLRCVEAINHPKAYVLATRLMQNNVAINKQAIRQTGVPLTLDNLVNDA